MRTDGARPRLVLFSNCFYSFPSEIKLNCMNGEGSLGTGKKQAKFYVCLVPVKKAFSFSWWVFFVVSILF